MALPLVNAEPNPCAVAMSNMFWIDAAGREVAFGRWDLVAAAAPMSTTASMSVGERNAFSRACSSWSARGERVALAQRGGKHFGQALALRSRG